VDGLLLALRVVRVDVRGRRVAGSLTTAEALAAHGDLGLRQLGGEGGASEGLSEREHGGKFEIHVTGGGVILPQWYEPRWSRGTHGLFANQAADGTVTLTAVAWESVQKIVVRQVEGLPDGMFE
jgi:hypothetical protein